MASRFKRSEVKYQKLQSVSRDEEEDKDSSEYYDDQYVDTEKPTLPIRSIVLSIFLFVIGTMLLILAGLLIGGVFGSSPDASATPLLILGAITFIPGFYHVRLAYYAFKGYHGYSFSDIPNYS